MAILFYSTHGDYGQFSNFAAYPLVYKGHKFKTSEHAFQAMKFEGTSYMKKVMEAKSPKEAAELGRNRRAPLRRDWESVKYGIMKDIVLAKFMQHDDLKALLLSTGDEKIYEHTDKDKIWADGGDGSGKNWLGLILMEVRAFLRPQTNL
jgi:ribA/ribD-fused uncharacterized protein